MTCLGVGPGVRLVGWIEVSAGRGGIGRAAIAEFMDVKAMLTGSQTSDIRLDLHSVGDLSEGDGAAHVVARSGMQHCDGFERARRFFGRCLRARGNAREQQKY